MPAPVKKQSQSNKPAPAAPKPTKPAPPPALEDDDDDDEDDSDFAPDDEQAGLSFLDMFGGFGGGEGEGFEGEDGFGAFPRFGDFEGEDDGFEGEEGGTDWFAHLMELASGEGEMDADNPVLQKLMQLSQDRMDDGNDDEDDEEGEEEEEEEETPKASKSIDDIDGIDDDIAPAPKPAKAKGAKAAFKLIDPLSKKHDFYEIFNIDRDATNDEIMRSYKRLALEYHPDRNGGDKQIEKKFVKVSQIHQTLIDSRKRKFYDTHGDIQSTELSEGFLSAYESFKTNFPSITADDTEHFKAGYLDTEEEYTDVVAAFNKHEGDLLSMMQHDLFFSDPSTTERDHKMVAMLIERGDITNPAFIAHFKANSVAKVKAAMVKWAKQEEDLYDELMQQAIMRAKKKARHGRAPTEAAIQEEMAFLVNQHNSKGNGADQMENMAMKLSSLAGHDGIGLDVIDAKVKANEKGQQEKKKKATAATVSTAQPPAAASRDVVSLTAPAKKGGRTASKQSKNTVLTDVARDIAAEDKKQAEQAKKIKAEQDAILAESLSKEPNLKKRSRK